MKSVLLQPTFTGAGPPVRSAPLDRLCDYDDGSDNDYDGVELFILSQIAD